MNAGQTNTASETLFPAVKKFLFACGLFASLSGALRADPCNPDAFIEPYAWGESMKAVREKIQENADWQKTSDGIILVSTKNHPHLLLGFHNDRLISVSKNAGLDKTGEEMEKIFGELVETFTREWGHPAPPEPCVGDVSVTRCTIIWDSDAVTQVRVVQRTFQTSKGEKKVSFVGYTCGSRDLLLKFLEENNRFGIRISLGELVNLLKGHPEHLKKILEGKRVRVDAFVKSVHPLKLERPGYEVDVTLRGGQNTDSFLPGQLVTVSGVVEGLKGDAIPVLSDAFFVPSPDDPGIMVDRAGKPPGGFFPLETLHYRLETAARQVEERHQIRVPVARPRLEAGRAVLDFFPQNFPGEFSFSLEPLYADNSGDTLSFRAHTKGRRSDSDPDRNYYLVRAGLGIILKASQPEVPLDDIWVKIKHIILDENGEVVVNGWTYRSRHQGRGNFTFSATAPQNAESGQRGEGHAAAPKPSRRRHKAGQDQARRN